MRLSGVVLALALGAAPFASAWSQPTVLSTQQAPKDAAAVSATTALPADTDGVTRAFEQRFPGIKVDGVHTTPVPGLYEVQIGTDLLYTDAQVDYVFQGSLIDARKRTDLTAARLEQLTATPFASLPLEHAVKQVKGSGARKIAVFEDPNCGYCKRLHETLAQVDDVTVYSFLLPILTPDSDVKARNIWCATDQAQTWTDWMVNAKVPAEAICDTPVEQVKALAQKLKVQGTPAIFFADNTRVNGALPVDELRKKLDALN